MISNELNHRILKLAPKYTASVNSPNTFESLVRNSVSGLVVYSGASELTIYGQASVNHAFRAWHDALHLKLNTDFTLEGESRVAIEQARLIRNDALGSIIIAEVVGQVQYFNKYGIFPVNQVSFIKNYLKGRF